MRMNVRLSVMMMLVLTACGGGEKAAVADSGAAGAAGAQVATAVSAGEEKYAQVCAVCHQANGMGVEGNFPPLANSEWMTGKPEVPIAIVLHGMQGEITVNGKQYNGVMAAWGESMTDADIAAVITHERTSWGNSASAVTADQVKAVRAQYASRTTPWTAADLKPLR